MRVAPDAVIKTLKAYDPELGLSWNESAGCWFFTVNGKELWAWRHIDGTLAINDLSSDEALKLVQMADNRRDGWDRLKATQQHVSNRRSRYAEDKIRYQEECAKESRAVVDFLRRGGPKPFISGLRSR